MSSSSGGFDDCASPSDVSPPPTRSDPWCSLMLRPYRRRPIGHVRTRPSVVPPFHRGRRSVTDSVMPRSPKRLLALGGLAAGGAAFLRSRRGGQAATAAAPAP